MRLQGVPVDLLDGDHIESLVTNRAGESRILEFKLTLPGQTSDEKKEFLADVTAFANTTGGVIVYGIETERDPQGGDTGIARRVAGIPGVNMDKEKQRLGAMLHDGLSPSLASHITIKDVAVQSTPDSVLVLGVTQSLARPHMVAFNHSNKFWRRSDTGKYQPDIAELRTMFLEAQSWLADAEAFRDARVARVRGQAAQLSLKADSSLFMHVLPLGRLTTLLSLAPVAQLPIDKVLQPPTSPLGFGYRFNADGFLIYTNANGAETTSYTQWLRCGGIEGYDSGIVGSRGSEAGEPTRLFWARETCETVTQFVEKSMRALTTTLEIDPPFVVLVSLFGLKGAYVSDGYRWLRDRHAVTDDVLILPAVVFEDTHSDVASMLKPVLNIVWQACGIAEAPPVRQ